MDRWRLPRWTGTHADVFAAVGLAELLTRGGGHCRIETIGPSFEVSVEPPLTADATDKMLGLGYLYLKAKREDAVPVCIPADEVLEYQQERERAKRYSAAQQVARATGSVIGEAAELDRPIEEWRLYQVLNILQGDAGPNRVMAVARRDSNAWRETLWESLKALQEGKPLEGAVAVEPVQLFNPQAAKGYARLKPDSTGRGDKTKNTWADPFVETLRYRGYFKAACPFFLGTKSEHVRVLTPVPKRIGFRMYRDMVKDLRSARIFAASGPKLDCLATLTIAESLILRLEEYQEGFVMPSELVDSVSIVQYQSMGSAKAVRSIGQLGVPGWFPLTTKADAQAWLDVIGEHRSALRSLDDRNSNAIELLLDYRRFLERRGPQAVRHLLDFAAGYGILLLLRRAQNRWTYRQFGQRGLEVVLGTFPEYSEILENRGFLAIADALRSATVSAQWRKRNKMEHREIRYDVLPELRRKRLLPGTEPFLEAVADFVASYNAESGKRLENARLRTGNWRITAAEFAAFASLLDGRKDAASIGALLCAYATCRTKQEAEPSGTDKETEETESAEA
jgi:hypothetical protein